MKEKFNIALKNQYKDKKIDVVAIVGDVIIFVADSEMIVASITIVTKKENNEPIRATGENQNLVNHLNYIANGEQDWNLVKDECDEYVLVDGMLCYFSHEKTVPVVKENNISYNTTIGDDISLCI